MRMTASSALMVATALVAPLSGGAQGIGVGQVTCPTGSTRGDLGISGLDCRGECTLTMNEKGEEQAWSFTVEPEVMGVDPGGPSAGVLRNGDALVAIDGIPITTAEGGRRFANLEPDREVRIQFRRDGRLSEATLRTGSTCPPQPPLGPEAVAVSRGASRITVGRLVSRVPPDTVGGVRRTRLGVAPRVVLAPGDSLVAVPDSVRGRVRPPSRAVARPPRPEPEVPEGRLGISFSCGPCTLSRIRQDSVGIWDFSGPIEVIGVDPGGPADLVGIQLGDQITAVNGERLESREGGEIFSRMTPGDSLELTLVKRSGEERLVSVVPVTSDSLSTAVRLRTRGGLGISRSVGPVAGVVVPHADLPVPTAAEPPEGLPLRYSGTVEGVEVEVRGAPVTVSEMQDARILLINADGIWIRVRVPARRREAPESR